MVLGPDGQPLVGRIEAGSPGDSPAEESAIPFEPEIVVQPRRIVLLNQVGEFAFPRLNPFRPRLGRLSEVPFALIFFEGHLTGSMSTQYSTPDHEMVLGRAESHGLEVTYGRDKRAAQST